MEDNIFNIASQGSPVVQPNAYSDASIDELALDTDPSDLMMESLSQEDVIGSLREYLTKLDKQQPSQSTNAKGDIKGEVEQIERLIEDLEGKESTDPSTLRKSLAQAKMAFEKAEKTLTQVDKAPEASHKLKKTASLRRMLAETASARQLQSQILSKI